MRTEARGGKCAAERGGFDFDLISGTILRSHVRVLRGTTFLLFCFSIATLPSRCCFGLLNNPKFLHNFLYIISLIFHKIANSLSDSKPTCQWAPAIHGVGTTTRTRTRQNPRV